MNSQGCKPLELVHPTHRSRNAAKVEFRRSPCDSRLGLIANPRDGHPVGVLKRCLDGFQGLTHPGYLLTSLWDWGYALGNRDKQEFAGCHGFGVLGEAMIFVFYALSDLVS